MSDDNALLATHLVDTLRGIPVMGEPYLKPGTYVVMCEGKIQETVDLLTENAQMRKRIEAALADVTACGLASSHGCLCSCAAILRGDRDTKEAGVPDSGRRLDHWGRTLGDDRSHDNIRR